MASLMERLKGVGTIKEADVIADSKFFNEKDVIPTELPVLNIAFSGDVDGGLVPGISLCVGESRTFKTGIALYAMSAYLKKYPESVAVFYDSEGGCTQQSLEMSGIDTSRVLHIPIENIEVLKFDIVKRLEEVNRGDKVFFLIDSIGGLASIKEVTDALDGKSVTDLTRAKSLRGLMRMITPHFNSKDIPCVAISHSYLSQDMFPKTIVGGGCMVKGTKVVMYDGSLKEIQDIIPNDIVKTLDGDKPVTYSWNPDTLDVGEPECYEVEFDDGFKCVVSDVHKFLTHDGWVESKMLQIGQEVVSETFVRVKSVKPVGKLPVYDISVKDAEHYVLENGVVTHNTAMYYFPNQIFIFTRSQEKDAEGLSGWNFTINVEKSRFVKEKSKLKFLVDFDDGIYRYSGLQDLAIEFGMIKQSGAWYQIVDLESGELVEKKIRSSDIPDSFYESLLKNDTFKEKVSKKFKLTSGVKKDSTNA